MYGVPRPGAAGRGRAPRRRALSKLAADKVPRFREAVAAVRLRNLQFRAHPPNANSIENGLLRFQRRLRKMARSEAVLQMALQCSLRGLRLGERSRPFTAGCNADSSRTGTALFAIQMQECQRVDRAGLENSPIGTWASAAPV